MNNLAPRLNPRLGRLGRTFAFAVDSSAECLDDWIDEENPVRAFDAFVDALDLADLGFDGVEPAASGRPAFHP